MIAPRFPKGLRRLGPVVFVAASLLFAAAACEKVPLLAPTGSTITLTSSASTLPLGGSTTILAQVTQASGNAPHSGTQVSFTTNLGSVTPAQVSTDVNGQVSVTFNAGSQSGTATINATSGGATTSTSTTTGTTTTTGALKIAIGAAAVGRVIVGANPAAVSSQGGSATITASVVDTNGNALAGVPVSFTTTAGSLTQSVVNTDQNGNAQTTLTTSQQATVTASVGAQAPSTGTGTGTTTSTTSATVTVNVTAVPTLLITPPTGTVSAGLAASFTFAVTVPSSNGSAVRGVHVDWGDGRSQDLGAITGSAVVAHAFGSPGSYTVSATLTDAVGNTVPAQTTVVVTAKPQPVVSITAPTTTPTAGTDTVFTGSVAIAASTPTVIDNVTIDFGDGTVTSLGAVAGTNIALHHVYSATTVGNGKTFTVMLTATDSNGGVGTATTTVFVQVATPLGVTLVASGTTGATNTIETFTATVTGLGNAAVLSYYWKFDNNDAPQTTTSNQVTHSYAHGTISYTPSVTVTTSAPAPNNTATATTVITP
jgi:adhesin/invasin